LKGVINMAFLSKLLELRDEKSEAFNLFSSNNSTIEILENKGRLSFNEFSELNTRKRLMPKYANDIYYKEIAINKLLNQYPKAIVIGYSY
jgi:hypothetical protein